jgi:hypothetical protein
MGIGETLKVALRKSTYWGDDTALESTAEGCKALRIDSMLKEPLYEGQDNGFRAKRAGPTCKRSLSRTSGNIPVSYQTISLFRLSGLFPEPGAIPNSHKKG